MEMSYQGVAFTPEQNALLNNDLALIDNLNAELKSLVDARNQSQASINVNDENIASCQSLGSPSARNACSAPHAANKDFHISTRDSIDSVQIPQKQAQINAAVANYNSDLAAVQNAIKLSIQASVANSTASAQAAQNQVSIQQNNPTLLAEKLKLSATLDAQKRAQQIKFVGFILVAGVVVLVGWYVIKKLL